jgi:hypothetical protein
MVESKTSIVTKGTVDTSKTTTDAYSRIKAKNLVTSEQKPTVNLGKDDVTWKKSPVFKTKVKAWTQDDNQVHKYFHSLSIDVQIQDFTGTAELRCPYDSDLIEYWEPIRQTVVIYGSNRGDYKVLFVGRVREVKQDGYELSITFQNYGWKFQQNATTKFVEDNVKNKDGYAIIRSIFEALKIDSYSISNSAKTRLKQVGINDNGNLTLNGQEVEEMPDLLERLKDVDMSDVVSPDMIKQKLREDKLANIKNINYTLKYEEPTKVMTKINSESNYTAGGSNVYKKAYSGGSSAASTNTASTNTAQSAQSKKNEETNDNVEKKIRAACKGKWLNSSIMYSVIIAYKVFHGGISPSSQQAINVANTVDAYFKKYPSQKKYLLPCLITLRKGANVNKTWGPCSDML